MAGELPAAAFEDLVEQSVDLLTVVDEAGRIEYKSAASERILGRPPAEAVGTNVFDDIHPDDRQMAREVFDDIRTASAEYTTANVELRFRHADGSWVWLESRLSNQTGTAIDGYTISSRDVTDRKAYEQQLERERDRLARFASFLSHDLRNPLNVATGHVSILQDEYAHDSLDTLSSALDRMDDLIDDGLTLVTEMETEPLTEAVGLRAVAATCWENVDTRAATLDVQTDQYVLADESQLQSLLENLVRNAVEHGGEDVRVTVGDLDTGFYVEDDGAGFPADDVDSLLEYGVSTKPHGTGLGLSIVSEVAENHDWTLRVTAADAGGARFEVTGVDVLE